MQFSHIKLSWIIHLWRQKNVHKYFKVLRLYLWKFLCKIWSCGEVCMVCSKEFGVCVFNCTHYRETESQFAMRTRKGNHSTYQGQFYIGSISCTGDELSLSDCTVVTISVARCNAGHTIVDCTTGNYHSSAVRHSLIPRPHSYMIIVAWEWG